MPIIPTLRGQKQKDPEFKVSLGYIVHSEPSQAT